MSSSGLIEMYVGATGALGATGAVLGWLLRAGGRMHHASATLERIEGLLEPAGEAPGLSERLRALENGQRALECGQSRIEAQLQPNGGASTRDAINRVEAAVQALTERLPPEPPP